MLTIRVDENLRAALRKRAAAQGKSVSKVVREISGALEERPLSVRVGHLRGQLELPSEASETSDAWQIELRERSWRP
jgi:plasmid stability protein